VSESRNGTPRAPKPVIEQESASDAGANGASAASSSERASGSAGASAHGFQDTTIGFFKNFGARAWEFADSNPHAVLYGLLGLVVAVLVLWCGLWATIVMAVFAGIGALIGRARDREHGGADTLSRMFGKRR